MILFVLIATTHWASAAAAKPVEFPPVSENAALQYWQAFASLPALDADQEKLLENWAQAPLNEATRELLKQSHASLMFLHRGAKLRECDWGFDYRDGISLHLPHLAKARVLARLAALDARRAFEEGHSDRARDDSLGMVAMARQIGGDHTLVSMLVCYAIEGMTVDLVAPYLPQLGASRSDALRMFETLPPSPTLAHGVMCEKRLAYSIIRQLQEAEQRRPGSWREVWQSMLGPDVANPLKEGDDFDDLIKLLEDFQLVYDELAVLTALPPKEFDAKLPAFAKAAEAANPVAKLLLPAMEKVVAAQRRAEVRMAMLLAGIAVVEGGSEKLSNIKDPFSGAPFQYRGLDTGFELASDLEENGEPVTLMIGRRGAPTKP
jgi:hypothetical protein